MSRASWVAAAMFALGCGGAGAGDKAEAPLDSGFVIDVAPPPAAYDSLARCAPDGKWAVCTVMYRLTRAGFGMVRDSGVVTEPALMQAGMRLHFGAGALSIFLYTDSINRRRDAADLDPKNFISPEHGSTPNKRTLVQSANMLVIMDVPNVRARQRISEALLAGPPSR